MPRWCSIEIRDRTPLEPLEPLGAFPEGKAASAAALTVTGPCPHHSKIPMPGPGARRPQPMEKMDDSF